jgi:hypothetical protein
MAQTKARQPLAWAEDPAPPAVAPAAKRSSRRRSPRPFLETSFFDRSSVVALNAPFLYAALRLRFEKIADAVVKYSGIAS